MFQYRAHGDVTKGPASTGEVKSLLQDRKRISFQDDDQLQNRHDNRAVILRMGDTSRSGSETSQ